MTGIEVAVAADRALVAETLSAAVAACGLTVVRLPWEGTPEPSSRPWRGRRAPADQAILLCDLGPATIDPARRLLMAYPSRWILLTDTPRGPEWGALLELGVVGVLPSRITLDDLVTVIEELAAGRQPVEVPGRDELVAAWHDARALEAAASAHLRTLTRREREILELLASGLTVPQIAELNDSSPSTVRTQIRSVLRKLGVHSQLAAVALLVRAEGREPGGLNGRRP
ncbi:MULTISPECIES: helix-turn-helix transcriptional regulator [Nocardioides]|uniref:LuxR C-terminal-related transcriptional regulator n=1 Tax=Nocardioides vastitatis TaxID=2568655 RepID=A0ABW0ZCW1_9ACTN|nr:response regulator transcription factor [Nocardioides sp.]THI96944.1 response regulator transcription factor [Nocardioides sp.]